MTTPTKADLTAAVAKLSEENAGLRDFIAAVSECARSVPQAAPGVPDWKELLRATGTLIAIAVVTDPARNWEWGWANGYAAKNLREEAAKPVNYEVAVPAPSAVQDPAEITVPA